MSSATEVDQSAQFLFTAIASSCIRMSQRQRVSFQIIIKCEPDMATGLAKALGELVGNLKILNGSI